MVQNTQSSMIKVKQTIRIFSMYLAASFSSKISQSSPKYFDIPVIGITGGNGKTIQKSLFKRYYQNNIMFYTPLEI